MRTVVITGGSRGIGAAAVETFTGLGDRVYFLYEKNEQAAADVAARTGATAIRCDVADPAAVQAAFSEIGPADVLVCSAGIADYGMVNDLTPARLERIFAVNVQGMFYCVQAALPGMLHNHAGCIVTVSSMWGQVGASCEVAYSAAKGAVIAMTKALAKELGPSGIRVNAVSPGVIATDMVANLDAQTMESLREETPLERLGSPQDVADAMAYLASAQASFITGQILPVNGGFVI